MECLCTCTYDADRPEVSDINWPKARKAHECCECGEAIGFGQRYERVKGLWDGHWDTYKTCLTCVRIRDDLCPRGFIYSALRETIWECFGVDYVSGELWEDSLGGHGSEKGAGVRG
jgi:hypothetical protein